ncbi:MAG: hypothetical protein K2Q20_00280 [Phycisphaerales bacterium]|nr:hypothetical protein [Phycisphaerales bacterium]
MYVSPTIWSRVTEIHNYDEWAVSHSVETALAKWRQVPRDPAAGDMAGIGPRLDTGSTAIEERGWPLLWSRCVHLGNGKPWAPLPAFASDVVGGFRLPGLEGRRGLSGSNLGRTLPYMVDPLRLVGNIAFWTLLVAGVRAASGAT